MAAIQNCTFAIQRVLEVLDLEPVIRSRPDAVVLGGMKQGVRFDHVDFAYVPDNVYFIMLSFLVPVIFTF